MTWNAAFGMRNAESRASDGQTVRVVVTHPAFRLPPSALAVRRRVPRATGFTLVELLIVMAILAILAALLLGVAARAGERGREARTKAMIARLHTLVMEHYDTYKNRRAPVDDVGAASVSSIIDGFNTQERGPAMAEARLYALRELMVLEMPDRWSDVLLAPVSGNPRAVQANQPRYLKSNASSTFGGPTPLNEAYRRQYYTIAQNATADQILDNQGAECLYMIVMFATADGEARSLFNESSIGDVDGDGAPEFLDGWGRPINFLRWAPGFDSDLQLNANDFSDETQWISQADTDHDPFDVFRSDPYAFRLVPLIFSAGGDESYGIRTIKPSVTWQGVAPGASKPYAARQLRPTPMPNRRTYLTPRLTPFTQFSGDDDGVNAFYGTVRDETAADNINNHSIASE